MINKMTQLNGIHHVTAITDSAERNYEFFTQILGMRLVKKTVNQDDIYTYHTFFADDKGNAGTDMTFFDFPNIPKGQKGTNSISRVGLRVPTDKALEYYMKRFEEFGVKHDGIQKLNGAKVLPFEESDGQLYQLFSDENNTGIEAGIPWQEGPVPTEHAIYGLGPIEITVSYYEDFKQILETIYGMTVLVEEDKMTIYEMADGGHGGQVILRHVADGPQAREGYGQVHHVAFRVKDHDQLNEWLKKYREIQVPNSGLVDRFYFEALYARIGHILIEISTDGPGFMQDEPYETMGESLSLPPKLESQREYIEGQVRHFDTTWKGTEK